MDDLGKIAWGKLVFHAALWFHRFVSFPAVPWVSRLRSFLKKKCQREAQFLANNSEKIKGHPKGHTEKRQAQESRELKEEQCYKKLSCEVLSQKMHMQ